MKEKLKIKCVVCGILAVIGIVMIVLSIQVKSLTGMQSGYMSGFGNSVTAASLALLIKNIIALRNPKKLKDREIELTDERNIQISTRAMAITFRICILLQAIGSMILVFMNNELGIYLGIMVGVQVVVYILASVIISKKI